MRARFKAKINASNNKRFTNVEKELIRGILDGLKRGINVGTKTATAISALASAPPKSLRKKRINDTKNVTKNEKSTVTRTSVCTGFVDLHRDKKTPTEYVTSQSLFGTKPVLQSDQEA